MAGHSALAGAFPANERILLSRHAETKQLLISSCEDNCCTLYTAGIHTAELEPPANGVYDDTPKNPHKLTRMHKLDDQSFHFAFMPIGAYAPFRALQFSYTSLPIVAEPFNGLQYYWLDKDLIPLWQALEEAIDVTIYDICQACNISVPLNYNPARDFRPSRYKYNRGHRDSYKARQAAYTALRAFDARMCMLSYVYFYAAKQGWDAFEALGSLSRIPTEFVQTIKSSWICNPDFPRVGVYIESATPALSSSDMQWRKNLWPFLLVHALPIWIAYDEKPFVTKDSFCLAFLPTDEEIERTMASAAPGLPQDSRVLASTAPPPPPKNLSVFAWLQNRLAQRARHLAQESVGQRIAREQREEEHRKHMIPGRAGPRVFEWEYDAELDDWLRVSIPRSDRSRIEGLWEETLESMRAYDGVRNEWDVYSGLHPSVDPKNPYAFIENDNEFEYGSDAVVDDNDLDWEKEQQRMINREASHFHQQRTTRSRSPQRRTDGQSNGRSRTPPRTPVSDRVAQHLLAATQLPAAAADTAWTLEDAEMVARDRYAVPFQSGWDTSPTITPLTPDHVWVLNVIRITSAPNQTVRQQFIDNLSNCVHNIVERNAPPSTHADFGIGSLLHERYKWRATPIPLDKWVKPTSMRLTAPREQTPRGQEPSIAGDQPYLVEHIDSSHANTSWRLVLFGAADTSHAIRAAANENIEEKLQLAARLASIGIPFRTLAKRDAKSVLLERAGERRIGLGYQNPNYVFTGADYARYERRRDVLLAMTQGREAGLAGGILARLAASTVYIEDILQGPSFTAATATFAILDDEEYVDDTLTENEVDVICGVTRIFTHWSEHSNVKIVSWWPTPKLWKRSGQDVGYWTAQNETWFQNRLTDIRAGKAKPLTAAAWKSTLKFFKDTPHFERNLAHFSRQVLQSRESS
ncbi:hypothetical protein PsYK624_163040 [Phanerochaete sordida]|uniref:Uncharacterized protein n=1 Tax=Phanerochaete sordida TaxID=48140 RepID=A0A9P3GRV0_9APHY|nr:hypothetical protein PsYK624_163040 [Phanerochaete sordida]